MWRVGGHLKLIVPVHTVGHIVTKSTKNSLLNELDPLLFVNAMYETKVKQTNYNALTPKNKKVKHVQQCVCRANLLRHSLCPSQRISPRLTWSWGLSLLFCVVYPCKTNFSLEVPNVRKVCLGKLICKAVILCAIRKTPKFRGICLVGLNCDITLLRFQMPEANQ